MTGEPSNLSSFALFSLLSYAPFQQHFYLLNMRNQVEKEINPIDDKVVLQTLFEAPSFSLKIDDSDAL